MTRIVNHLMKVLYPALIFMGAVLAGDLSGQAELANLNLPPVGEGFIPWVPTVSLRSSCDQKKGKLILPGMSCSVSPKVQEVE
jgi:hypothetical protein